MNTAQKSRTYTGWRVPNDFLHPQYDTKSKIIKCLREVYKQVRYSGKDKCFYVGN